MNTAQTHTFVTPVVREIRPASTQAPAERTTQRDRVLASLLARP